MICLASVPQTRREIAVSSRSIRVPEEREPTREKRETENLRWPKQEEIEDLEPPEAAGEGVRGGGADTNLRSRGGEL